MYGQLSLWFALCLIELSAYELSHDVKKYEMNDVDDAQWEGMSRCSLNNTLYVMFGDTAYNLLHSHEVTEPTYHDKMHQYRQRDLDRGKNIYVEHPYNYRR